ncbi:MAG: hypothetical protein ACFFKA_18550, partial [Candidatus Thorarchaeota archaeon]
KISREEELEELVHIRLEQIQEPQKLVSEEKIELQKIPEIIEETELRPTINLEASLIINEPLGIAKLKEESLTTEEFIEEKHILESEDNSMEKVAAIEITEQPQQQERLEEWKKAQETLEEETLQVSEGKDEEEFKMEDLVPSGISQIEVKEKGITESSPPLIPQMIKQTMGDRKFVKEKEMKAIDRKDVHFCINCGKPLVDTWKICAYCGLNIRKDLWKTESKIERETISLEKEFEMPIDESQKFPVIEDIKQDFKEKIKSIELTKIISEESINEVQEIPLKESEPSLFIEVPKVREKTKPIEAEPVEPKPVKNLCPFCGSENILEKKYCKQCGYKLKK